MKVPIHPKKGKIMTKFTSLVVTSLVTLLIDSTTLATNLQAQNDDAITIRVPFSFTVGTQSIAPGTYRFSLVSSQFLLSVVNIKTGDMNLFVVRPEQQRAVDQHARLVFRNTEGSSVLNEVHFSGTSRFSEVVQLHGDGRIEAKKSRAEGSITVAQR
jgi:hypothetical protein